jgi:hypothetical protein
MIMPIMGFAQSNKGADAILGINTIAGTSKSKRLYF